MEIKTKVFENKDKKSEKAPDYSSTTEVNGEKLQVAVWKNTDGSLYLQIKPKEQR